MRNGRVVSSTPDWETLESAVCQKGKARNVQHFIHVYAVCRNLQQGFHFYFADIKRRTCHCVDVIQKYRVEIRRKSFCIDRVARHWNGLPRKWGSHHPCKCSKNPVDVARRTWICGTWWCFCVDSVGLNDL